MPLYRFIASNLLAPALDLARGTRTMKCLAELNRSQWWAASRITALQDERLRKLIQYSYENVPYYRQVFDAGGLKPQDISSAEDLSRLPILTRDAVRRNFATLTPANFPLRERLTMHTGGSTGEPLTFFRSKDDQQNWGFAAAERAFSWTGYHLGDKKATLTVVRPSSSRAQAIYIRARDTAKRTLTLDAKKLSAETIPLYAALLCRFKPKIIHAYPSALELVARFIQTKSSNEFRPQAIIAGAEQLYDYQRELFKEVFSCETYRYYSSWEAHAIASECSMHTGLHISAENVIVEIVNKAGLPVKEGIPGRLLITNLHNFAMPFIRYEIGDEGTMSTGPCACGRGLPLLERLEGRASDTIVTAGGRRIPGTALVHIFREPMGIAQFQLIQENRDSLIINVVPETPFLQNQMDRLAGKITTGYRALLGNDIKISVSFVDSIKTTADGKRRFIISNIKESRDGKPD